MIYCCQCQYETESGSTAEHVEQSGHKQFTHDPYIAWLERGWPD